MINQVLLMSTVVSAKQQKLYLHVEMTVIKMHKYMHALGHGYLYIIFYYFVLLYLFK